MKETIISKPQDNRPPHAYAPGTQGLVVRPPKPEITVQSQPPAPAPQPPQAPQKQEAPEAPPPPKPPKPAKPQKPPVSEPQKPPAPPKPVTPSKPATVPSKTVTSGPPKKLETRAGEKAPGVIDKPTMVAETTATPQQKSQEKTETTDILFVMPGGKEGEYVVRIQIPGGQPGAYTTKTLSRQEVLDRGGQIPIAGNVWATGAGLKMAAGSTMNTQQSVLAEFNMSLSDWNTFEALLDRFKKNPMSDEFKIAEAGGTPTFTQKIKDRLAELAGIKYDTMRDVQQVYQHQQEIKKDLIPVGTDITIGNFQNQVITEYAKEHGITKAEAMKRIDALRDNPDSKILKDLSEIDREALQLTLNRVDAGRDYISKTEFKKLQETNQDLAKILQKKGFKAAELISTSAQKHATAKFEASLKEVDPEGWEVYQEKGHEGYVTFADKREKEFEANHTQNKTGEWYENNFLTALKNSDPVGMSVLMTKGFDAYNDFILERFQRKDPEGYKVYKDAGGGDAGWDAYDQFVEQRGQTLIDKNYVTIGDSSIKREDWDSLPVQYKARANAYGFENMFSQMDKDNQSFADNLKENFPELYDVYTKQGPEAYNAIIDEISKDHPDAAVLAKYLPADMKQVYNDPKTSPQDKFSILQASGILPKDTRFSAVTQSGQPMISQGADFSQTVMELSPVDFLILGAEIFVPGVYLARHWHELPDWQKVLFITLDAAAVGLVGSGAIRQAGAAAREVGYASRLARIKAAAGVLGQVAIAQIKAPLDVIIHPIQTLKGIKSIPRDVRDFVELLVRRGRVREAAITTSSGQVLIRAQDVATLGQAEAASNKLMAALARGDKLNIQIGDRAFSLAQSPLMKKAGGAAHATPDLTEFEKGLTVKFKKNIPVDEQGLFLSNEPVTQYAFQSATGKGAIPLATEASGKAQKVWYYRPGDIARMDAIPIRDVVFNHAKKIPNDLAQEIEEIARRYNARVGGSFNAYIKVPRAPRPNDIDLIIDSAMRARKVQDEIIRAAKRLGYEAREGLNKRKVELLKGKKWESIVDIDDLPHHNSMIPEEYVQPTRKLNGFDVETLGEQYIRQSFGTVTETTKTKQRIRSIDKMAKELKKMLEADGASVRVPGVVILSPKTARMAGPTSKTFKLKELNYQTVKEVESKLGISRHTEGVQQKLWFRAGPRGLRFEVWLEKPLSNIDILRLKDLGLFEDIKSIVRPAIKVEKRAGAIAAESMVLTDKEVSSLTRELLRSGNISRSQADNILRAYRIIRASERVPVAEGRLYRPLQRSKVTREALRRVSRAERREARARIARVEARRVTPVPRLRQLELTRLRETPRRGKIPFRTEELVRPPRGSRIPAPPGRTSRTQTGRTSRLPTDRTSRLPTDRTSRLPTPDRLTRVPPPKPPGEPPRPPRPPEGPRPPRPPTKSDKPYKPLLPGGGDKKEWTPEEIKSALAWKFGAVVHALKSPYRRGIDEKTFSIKNLPSGLVLMKEFKGPGSAQKSLRVIEKKFPAKLTTDVGNQDVIFAHGKGGRVGMRFTRDTTGTVSQTTIKRLGRNISKKRGKVYHTKTSGGTIVSRRPVRGY